MEILLRKRCGRWRSRWLNRFSAVDVKQCRWVVARAQLFLFWLLLSWITFDDKFFFEVQTSFFVFFLHTELYSSTPKTAIKCTITALEVSVVAGGVERTLLIICTSGIFIYGQYVLLFETYQYMIFDCLFFLSIQKVFLKRRLNPPKQHMQACCCCCLVWLNSQRFARLCLLPRTCQGSVTNSKFGKFFNTLVLADRARANEIPVPGPELSQKKSVVPERDWIWKHDAHFQLQMLRKCSCQVQWKIGRSSKWNRTCLWFSRQLCWVTCWYHRSDDVTIYEWYCSKYYTNNCDVSSSAQSNVNVIFFYI